MNCRSCGAPLRHAFLDLGFAPPSNAYVSRADLDRPERHYPLRLKVCDACWLVQTEDYADAGELFSADYAYFSSTSQSWLRHAADYARAIAASLNLGADSFVVEVASNDGYLLRNFLAAGIPCLGIEPTASTAAAAEALGIPVLREFFGSALGGRLAAEHRQADLIIGNNVFAHVPDINDFTTGLAALLKPSGTITLEFPHLLRLIEQCQFDTVYHEHFSYLSLHAVERILDRAGLRLVDVEELSTHGGSLRIHAMHAASSRPATPRVAALLAEERRRGLCDLAIYQGFQARAERIKDDLLMFLIGEKRAGRRVAAYGAAAKGCTLLNFAGVRPDLVPYVCDAAPSKQGKFLPGSHIPILPPAAIADQRPDTVLILPWNLAGEITAQLSDLAAAGTRFAVAIPEIKLLDAVRA